AYLNPLHERRLAEIVGEEAPEVRVTMSHEVSPTFREYERTSTTVVNAYVMTAVRAYLRGLAAALAERGSRGRLFVMQSSGGVATAEAMQRYPVRMIESGPAAGALMAAVYGELTGYRDLIAFDMGGTTAKLALIEGGRPSTTRRGGSTLSSTPTWSWRRAWSRSSAAATRAISRSSPSAGRAPCTAAASPRRSPSRA